MPFTDDSTDPMAPMASVADRLISPVAVVAADSTLLYINPAGAHAIGQEPGWLLGRRMLELVHPDDRARIESELRRVVAGLPSAGWTAYRLRASPTRDWLVLESAADNLFDDPTVGGILLSSRDITEQVAREQALHDAAYRDPLTRLRNRAAITDALDVLTAEQGSVVAVGFVGIDRFDLIRNSLGHTTMDKVMQLVAARVRAAVPDSILVGRFGTDMLAIVLAGSAARGAHDLLWRVIERVSEPGVIEGRELRLSASAGLAVQDALATADSLLHDAALAFHRATSAGGGRVEIFEQALRDEAVARLELEADLRRALANNELWVALQPIVRLADEQPIRSEALLRWDHPARTVEPGDFVPVAEDAGLLVPIGDWTIARAASLVTSGTYGQILVNLSPCQLAAPGLPERIGQILAARRVPPAALGFEVTESLLIEHFDYAAEILYRIRRLGCSVGLDDFGTGYSSLSYLRRLPLDFIKIDGSLTADIDTDPQASAIVGAIIAMADALHLDVIAEGVESPTQAAVLTELGCAQAQGYLYGHPTRPVRAPGRRST